MCVRDVHACMHTCVHVSSMFILSSVFEFVNSQLLDLLVECDRLVNSTSGSNKKERERERVEVKKQERKYGMFVNSSYTCKSGEPWRKKIQLKFGSGTTNQVNHTS